jgi:hypothetical protein
MREDGSRRTTQYDIDLFKCIFCENSTAFAALREKIIANELAINQNESI